jgi:hypothetical protein
MRRLANQLLRGSARGCLRPAGAPGAGSAEARVLAWRALSASLTRLRPGEAGVHSKAAGKATAAPPAASAVAHPASPDVLHVEVRTGDVRGGGCSSPAALTLYGDEGARSAEGKAGEPLTPPTPPGESAELPLDHEEDTKGAWTCDSERGRSAWRRAPHALRRHLTLCPQALSPAPPLDSQ